MKKISKLKINPEKLMKNEELMTLRGGTTYECYRYGWMPDGWCEQFITYINTTDCGSALYICNQVYEGGCVPCN